MLEHEVVDAVNVHVRTRWKKDGSGKGEGME